MGHYTATCFSLLLHPFAFCLRHSYASLSCLYSRSPLYTGLGLFQIHKTPSQLPHLTLQIQSTNPEQEKEQIKMSTWFDNVLSYLGPLAIAYPLSVIYK